MRDTVKKKKKKTVGQANAVGAGSRKAYRRKKTAIVAAITLIYLVIVAAAAVIIDDRHVEITLLGDEEQLAEAGQQYLDPGAEAYLTGNLFGRTARPVELSVENSVDPARIGDYTVKYSAEAFGRSAESYRRAIPRLPSSRWSMKRIILPVGLWAIRKRAFPRSTAMTEI